MRLIASIFVCCLSLLLPINSAATGANGALLQSGGELLRYKVSYQGLLSLFLPVEIAEATLHLRPGVEVVDNERMRRASLAVTTESFPSMEAVYPLRFNYDSWFDSDLKYSVVLDVRKRTSKYRHELLWFNREQEVVRTYRKSESKGSGSHEIPGFLSQVNHLQQPDSFRERRVLKLDSGNVLDRLAMLYVLRNHLLTPGKSIDLAVSNGKDLLGYRIAVEAREQLVLDSKPISTLRLRFTPRFVNGGDRGYAVRVWMSDDERRLPVRFHSSKMGGSIELDLVSVDVDDS